MPEVVRLLPHYVIRDYELSRKDVTMHSNICSPSSYILERLMNLQVFRSHVYLRN
jgi:hypothetical protein